MYSMEEKNELFEPYWNSLAKVIELDGSGAHHRRYAEDGGMNQTTQITYAPSINSL